MFIPRYSWFFPLMILVFPYLFPVHYNSFMTSSGSLWYIFGSFSWHTMVNCLLFTIYLMVHGPYGFTTNINYFDYSKRCLYNIIVIIRHLFNSFLNLMYNTLFLFSNATYLWQTYGSVNVIILASLTLNLNVAISPISLLR